MNKKTTYRPPHSDGKKNILKTPSTMNFDKSSTKSIVLDSSLSQSLSVKNKPARQVQTEPTKKQIKHPSQANETTANVKSGSKLKIKKTRPPKATERKQNIEMKPGTQTKQPSKQISISPVKQLQSPVSIEDTNGVPLSKVENGETSNKKIHKKKTNSKKRQDGSSNWMKLCATMNIDATVRKTKPVKRPAPDSNTEQTEPKRVKPGVWFDNVDKILIETNPPEGAVVGHANSGLEGTLAAEHDTSDRLVKSDSFKGVTSCVAMDCEMVGVGPHGEESILARVSIVNHFGVCLYDKFVLPREKVTDYRTFVSGVTADKLATGEEFTKVQAEVSKLLHGRILVGHAVHNDLKVLFLTHPHKMIRDTSLYKPFRALFNGRLPSLKKLTEKVLAVRVQEGQHSSVQDAQATMRLYTMYRQKWEKELRKDRKMDRRKKKKKQHITESV